MWHRIMGRVVGVPERANFLLLKYKWERHNRDTLNKIRIVTFDIHDSKWAVSFTKHTYNSFTSTIQTALIEIYTTYNMTKLKF